MMKHTIMAIATAIATLVSPLPVLAGNAKMMQQNAENLIKMNEQVIQELDTVVKDGRLTLQARIKQHPDGHRVIYLDHLEVTSIEETEQVLTSSTGYKTFINAGALPAAEEFPTTGLTGGGSALGATTGWVSFEKLVDTQPEAKVIELKGSSIESISHEMQIKPERGFFIYW